MQYLIIALHLLCSPAKDSIPFPYPVRKPAHPFEWKDFEIDPPRRYKDSVITYFKKVFIDKDLKNVVESGVFATEFHFVNLNGDNLPDVIYEGWTGSEGIMTNMYLNEKKRFREVFHGTQHIINLSYTSNKLSSFVIYDRGCCDPTVEFDRHFSIDSSFHCQLTRQRAIIVGAHVGEHNYTIPDGFFDQPITFRTLNPKYALRYSPEVSDKVPDVDFDEKTKGNIMAEYSKDVKGIAWAYKKDATGREWWLVEMDPAFYLEYNLFWDYDDQYTHYFGWMSSRFVEKLPDPAPPKL